MVGGGGSKLVKSNLPRSKFPFIWGGCQSWSSQICLDLNFPLFVCVCMGGGGGRFQSWSSQICLDLNFPLFGGGVKVGQVKSAKI